MEVPPAGGFEGSKKDTYMNNVGKKRAGYFLVLLIFWAN